MVYGTIEIHCYKSDVVNDHFNILIYWTYEFEFLFWIMWEWSALAKILRVSISRRWKMSNSRTRILAHTKFLISIGYRSIYLVWFSDCLYCLEYIFYILKMLSLIKWLCNSLTFEFWIRCEFAYCMWFCIWGKLVRYKNYFSVLIIFWKNVVRTAF